MKEGCPLNKSESRYFNTAVKMDKALISLLERKSFEYITVSEICKEARVNRSTFYLHYENTCDLLDECIRYLIDSFLLYFDVDTSRISHRFGNLELSELNYITAEYVHPYLSYIKENHRIFSTALSNSGTLGFDSVFQQMFSNIFDPILERFHYPADDRRYVMLYYLNGVNAIVMQWIRDDCRKSIEEIFRIIQTCIFGLEKELRRLI